MSFSKEGDGVAIIKAADLIEPRFSDVPQGSFEIMLTVENEQGEKDAIYLEFSSRYGVGNNAQATQAQLSMESLAAIGWTHGADFSQIGNLVGKQINYYAKGTVKNGKTYINVYISKFEVKRLSAADVAARVAAMTGATAAAPAPAATPFNPFAQPAAAAPATAPNPFASR